MTYRTYTGSPFDPIGKEVDGSSPQSYMMFDISALQSMYGANFSRLGKADTYRWHGTTGQQTINGEQAPNTGLSSTGKIFSTVWTQGAAATYDLSAFSQDQVDDLRPGHWLTFSNDQLADLNPADLSDAVQGPGQHLQRAALLRRPQVGDRQPHHRHRQRHADRQRSRQRADRPATAPTSSSTSGGNDT